MNVSHPKQLNTSSNDAPKFSTTIPNQNTVAIATHGGKVLIQENQTGNEVKSLQINNKITALCSCDNNLIIGTNQYVLAVNPTDASTLFYRPVADEVTCISPCYSVDQETFVFMGGDSGSVTGLTRAGNDTFWTVLDSKITSILSVDEEYLITGTLGGRISKIKIIDNQVVDEVVKGDSVQKLVSLKSEGEIAYRVIFLKFRMPKPIEKVEFVSAQKTSGNNQFRV